MTGRNIGRRQAVIGTGAAVMTAAAHRATAADGDMAARLAAMEKDGRVFGLHTLLVWKGGRMVFEHLSLIHISEPTRPY